MVTNLDGLQRAIDIQSELSFLKGLIDVKSHADLRIVLEAGKRVNWRRLTAKIAALRNRTSRRSELENRSHESPNQVHDVG